MPHGISSILLFGSVTGYTYRADVDERQTEEGKRRQTVGTQVPGATRPGVVALQVCTCGTVIHANRPGFPGTVPGFGVPSR